MIGAIIGFTALACVSTAVCVWSYKYQAKIWNNGKCPHCGEEWHLDRIDTTSRTYHCDNGHYCILSNYNEK